MPSVIFDRPEIGFSPLRIANCIAWLSAPRITGVSDGAALTPWTDLSSGGNSFSRITAAASPIYQSSGGANGKPYVQFNGSTQGLTRVFGATISQPVTIFGVIRHNSNTAGNESLWGGINSDGSARSGVLQRTAGTPGTWSVPASLSGGAANTNWNIHEIVYNNTASIYVVNGTVNNGTTNAHNLARFGLGFDDDGLFTDPADCGYEEFIMYTGAVSASDRGQVRRWLGRQYGIGVAA